jgi:hypothetical protein
MLRFGSRLSARGRQIPRTLAARTYGYERAGGPGIVGGRRCFVTFARTHHGVGIVAHEMLHAAALIGGPPSKRMAYAAWEEQLARRVETLVRRYWQAWWAGPLAKPQK